MFEHRAHDSGEEVIKDRVIQELWTLLVKVRDTCDHVSAV